jgi:biopolymer transport protein ExbD
MRRFSQKQHLVTLSDINITPLLDLAFVLLIIFVITTPMLTQTLDIKLPVGGRPERKQLSKNDIKTIEISKAGVYRLDGRSLTLEQIERALVSAFAANPNLVVYIRADEDGLFKYVAKVIDCCQKHNISSISFRTQPKR